MRYSYLQIDSIRFDSIPRAAGQRDRLFLTALQKPSTFNMGSASTPGDTPLLRVYFDVPVPKSPTIEVNGVAVDFDGFEFFIYADGEQTTTTCFKLTPFGVPGALELHISRRHGVPGVSISLLPRVATAVLTHAGTMQPDLMTPHSCNFMTPHITHRFEPVLMLGPRPRGLQLLVGFQPLSSDSDSSDDEQPYQQVQPRRGSIKDTLVRKERRN